MKLKQQFKYVFNLCFIEENPLILQFSLHLSKTITSVLYRVSTAEITLLACWFGLSYPVGFASYCHFLICTPFAIDMRILRYFFVTFCLNSGGEGLDKSQEMGHISVYWRQPVLRAIRRLPLAVKWLYQLGGHLAFNIRHLSVGWA